MRQRGRPRHDDILTPREWEVLDLLRDGLTNEQIAERLGVTHDTAKFHVSQILGKLGVETRQEAARWAGRQRVLRTLGLPAVLLRKIASLSPLQLAGGAVIVAALVGLGVLAAGLLLTNSNPDPEPEPEVIATPESLTGDEVLDGIVASLLEDGAAQLAARFGGVTARAGYLVGGPVGFNDVQPVSNGEWTAQLAAASRALLAAVDPREPDGPPDIPGQPGLPAALFFDGQRDYDVILLADAGTPSEHLWRFSIQAGDVVDVIIERLEDDPRPGSIPLLYRIYTLLPSPDDDPGRFLVLPPDAYWPIPERVDRVESTPPAGRVPSIAPDGRTGDLALDAVVETLLKGSVATLQRDFGSVAARQELCVPDPDIPDTCHTQFQRVDADEWIDIFTLGPRSLYAVVARDPVDIVIVVDSGAPAADAWRFGIQNGSLVDVEFSVLDPGRFSARSMQEPSFFWREARSYTPNLERHYGEFLVLPPEEELPKPPSGHAFSVRTGDPGVDRLIALLEARDADGLVGAFASLDQVVVRDCRGPQTTENAAYVRSWADDTVRQAYRLRSVTNVPPGYHPTAQHVIEVVLQLNPLSWRSTAILESGGEVVGLLAGEDCYPGNLSPGARTYLVPPLDTTLARFDSSRRSGVPIIDAVLDAMQLGDQAALQAVIDYQMVPCGPSVGPGSPPPCPSGVADGTPVDAFPVTACEGGYATRDNPPRYRIGADGEPSLYAVVASSVDPDSTPAGASPVGVILLVNDGGGATAISVSSKGITSSRRGCGQYHPEWLTPQGEPDYLLPPLPGP